VLNHFSKYGEPYAIHPPVMWEYTFWQTYFLSLPEIVNWNLSIDETRLIIFNKVIKLEVKSMQNKTLDVG